MKLKELENRIEKIEKAINFRSDWLENEIKKMCDLQERLLHKKDRDEKIN